MNESVELSRLRTIYRELESVRAKISQLTRATRIELRLGDGPQLALTGDAARKVANSICAKLQHDRRRLEREALLLAERLAGGVSALLELLAAFGAESQRDA